MIDEVPRWKKVDYRNSASGQTPFDGHPVLVGNRQRIRQSAWVFDAAHPEGIWAFPYAEDAMSSVLFWLPVPTPGDKHWLSSSEAVARSAQPFERTTLVVKVCRSNGSIRWLDARHDPIGGGWFTTNRLVVPHSLISGGALVQTIPVVSYESAINGPTDQLWA